MGNQVSEDGTMEVSLKTKGGAGQDQEVTLRLPVDALKGLQDSSFLAKHNVSQYTPSPLQQTVRRDQSVLNSSSDQLSANRFCGTSSMRTGKSPMRTPMLGIDAEEAEQEQKEHRQQDINKIINTRIFTPKFWEVESHQFGNYMQQGGSQMPPPGTTQDPFLRQLAGRANNRSPSPIRREPSRVQELDPKQPSNQRSDLVTMALQRFEKDMGDIFGKKIVEEDDSLERSHGSDIDHMRTYQQFSPSELRPNYPQSPEENIRLVSEQENSPEAPHELLSASAFLKRLQGDKDQLTNPQTSVSSRNADSRDNMSFRAGNNGPWSKGVPTAFSTRETSALPEAYQRPPLPARPVSRSPLRDKSQQTNIPPRPVFSNSQSSYNSKPTNNQWSQGHSFRDNSHLVSTLPEAGRTHSSGTQQHPSAGKNYTEKVQMSFASVNLREVDDQDPGQRENAPDHSSKPRLTTGQGESIYYLQQEIGMCTNEGISPIKHQHDMLSAVQGERTSKYSGLNLDMSVINQTIDDCGNESRFSEAGLDTPVMKALSSIQGKIEELNMMMGKTASRRSARKSDFYDRSRQKTVTESGMKSIDPRQTLNSYATSAEKENYPYLGMHSLAFPDRQEAWSKKESDQEWMLRSGTTDLQLQPYPGSNGDGSEAQETYLVTSGATSRRLYA